MVPFAGCVRSLCVQAGLFACILLCRGAGRWGRRRTLQGWGQPPEAYFPCTAVSVGNPKDPRIFHLNLDSQVKLGAVFVKAAG